jgi:hypothetical protein
MTTIITRLFPDSAAANAAMAGLLDIGQREETIQIITASTAGGAAAAMKAARVSSASAAAYAKAMTKNQALLVVQAPFSPIGTALNAIKCLKRHPALDVGLEDEDVYLREYPVTQTSKNLMLGHPLLMSNKFRKLSHGHILGENPIIQSRPRTSAMRGGGFMSRFFWPMKLVSSPKQRSSAIRGGFLFSSLFGLPLLTSSWASRDYVPTIIR